MAFSKIIASGYSNGLVAIAAIANRMGQAADIDGVSRFFLGYPKITVFVNDIVFSHLRVSLLVWYPSRNY